MAAPVDINQATVKQLLQDPLARRKFPFLATAHKRMTGSSKVAKSRCNRCPRKAQGNQAGLVKLIKAIGQMPVGQKALLKEHLGGGQISVRYRSRRGKKVLVKF